MARSPRAVFLPSFDVPFLWSDTSVSSSTVPLCQFLGFGPRNPIVCIVGRSAPTSRVFCFLNYEHSTHFSIYYIKIGPIFKNLTEKLMLIWQFEYCWKQKGAIWILKICHALSGTLHKLEGNELPSPYFQNLISSFCHPLFHPLTQHHPNLLISLLPSSLTQKPNKTKLNHFLRS